MQSGATTELTVWERRAPRVGFGRLSGLLPSTTHSPPCLRFLREGQNSSGFSILFPTA